MSNMNNKKLNLIIKRDYNLLVISDLHCGHFSGLTSPSFQGKLIIEDIAQHNKLVNIQKTMWNFFSNEINQIKKDNRIDICVCNGDAIDGDGWRSGGTELITTDRNKQVAMAKSAIDYIGANTNIIIAGTGYHCGEVEDFEQNLATELKCKFESHAWLDINTKIFDIRHHVGSSSVPQSRFNPIAKEAVWGKLWAECDLIPNPVSYLIRSHVHYFSQISDDRMTALTTPALQGFGGKYGSRRCCGIPTIGFLSFNIKTNGTIVMNKHFANLQSQKAKATVFN